MSWTSPQAGSAGRPVQVFYTCLGDPTKPAMLLVHGFPTSSFDFRLFVREMRTDFRICTLDFPGYGLSDKPATGYRYTLADDATLLWQFVTEVVPMREFVLVSHDRGDSVALNFLQLYQAAPNPPFGTNPGAVCARGSPARWATAAGAPAGHRPSRPRGCRAGCSRTRRAGLRRRTTARAGRCCRSRCRARVAPDRTKAVARRQSGRAPRGPD